MIISITGKSGSGKTYLANAIAKILNAEVISFDQISHEALKQDEVISKIKTQFGDDLIANNIINRKKLGMIVFSDHDKLEFLNNLCQQKMEEIIDKLIDNDDKNYILEYALLPKMKYFNMSNIKILVRSHYSLRKTRIIMRDNITEEYFDLRDKNSINYNDYKFDLIINNDRHLNIETIVKQIKELL